MACMVAEGDNDRIRKWRARRRGTAREGAPDLNSGQPDRGEGRSTPRSRRNTCAAMWRATMLTRAKRLVDRRAFRVVLVRGDVSSDSGHLGTSALWGPQTVSGHTD